jgi:hypothetical protein
MNMKTILEHFEYEKSRKTDINEHLEVIKQYAEKCEHVTEMGVRSVVTTWALLAANPKRMVSIDIRPCPIHEAQTLAAASGIDFNFQIADTSDTSLQIEETDLLFIDTWHIYDQLKEELRLHSPKVRKYIIMHDTTVFAETGEPYVYNECKVKINQPPKGLWPAIEEFLDINPDWCLHERYTHNNGLTILAKK